MKNIRTDISYKKDFSYRILLILMSCIFVTAHPLSGWGNPHPEVSSETAAPRQIGGLVTDSDGNPMQGVTVIEQGTTNGTTTGSEGRFQINVGNGAILVFTFLGYNPEERLVSASADQINVRMTTASASIDDVVVVGYGVQKKSSAVASISTLSGGQIPIKQRNLRNSIAGQIAGVIAVQRSGEPGNDAAAFYIRGQSSYAGGVSPLVLVDGVPRSMDDIDVDEIESFTVLKDASATAVYGAEGANGVVLITTKRGTNQKTVINFSAQYSLVQPTRMPGTLGAVDFMSLYNEMKWNDAGNPDPGIFSPTYSADLIQKYRSGEDTDLYPSPNWNDLLKNTTSSQRYTINFRGGSEKARYFVSGAYYTESGIFKSTPAEDYNSNITLDRFNLRSNIDLDITKTTKLSVDMSGQYLDKNTPGYTSDEIFSLILHAPTHIIPMYYSDGTASQNLNSGWEGKDQPYNALNNSGYIKNWYAMLQTKASLTQELDFITDGLSVKGSVSFDADFSGGMQRQKTPKAYFATGRDPDTGELIKETTSEGSPLGNPILAPSYSNKNIYLEASLNYNRVFAEKHELTAMVLYMQKEKTLQNPDAWGVSLLPYRKQSFVARANYNFDNRYLVELSMGMTGSENFAAGYRWGIFPAVGLAWYVSNERFMQSMSGTLSKLKLRASVGMTGNDDISGGRFPYRGTINENTGSIGFGITTGPNGGVANSVGSGIAEGEFASPSISWEKERKFNVGFDLGLFDGRVDLTVDYFDYRRTDILLRRNTIVGMAGFRTSPYQNYGITTNRGVDASLILRHNFGKVNVSARGNITFARNKIVELDETPQKYPWMEQTGTSIGQPKVYIADGLYTPDDFNISVDPLTGAQTYVLKEGYASPSANVAPGDIRFKDLNGDGVLDAYDMTYQNGLYPTLPEIVYGFGANIEYKGFFAGVFFQGVGNTSVNLMSGQGDFYPFLYYGQNGSVRREALDRWTADNPYNQNVLFPRLSETSIDHNSLTSTWWYRNGNFLRLKNVEIGYEINSATLRKAWISKIRIYLQGTNLYVWDHVKYWDPEMGGANSGAKYPVGRTFTLGAEITF